MFGPKITTVFRSRWNALFWASGVLLTAYCSVPAQNEQGDADEIAALVKASKHPGTPPDHHGNPWAKDSPR